MSKDLRHLTRTQTQGVQEMSEQHKLFVKEYLVDLNATQAWIRAGGTPVHADRAASKLMKAGTMTANAIARAMAERSTRVGVSGDRIIRELARLAFGDVRVLFNPDGSLKAPEGYDEDDAPMIEGIKTRRIVEVAMGEDGKQKLVPVEIQEVKLASKTTALGMLMRHLGMNNDKLDVTVTPLAQRLEAAFKRTGTAPVAIADLDVPETIEAEYSVLDPEADDGPGADAGDDELRELLS